MLYQLSYCPLVVTAGSAGHRRVITLPVDTAGRTCGPPGMVSPGLFVNRVVTVV